MKQVLDSTNNPPALIAAGFVPNVVNQVFTLSTLQIVYFALLIPPAAYHCYVWARKTFWPTIKRWLS